MKLVYSIKEAKEFIGFGTTKMYEAINAGDLKAKKYGGKTLITHADLEAFVSSMDDYKANEVAQ